MNCKPNLLGASALYGTLALVALGTAQPARAACTTLTDDQQRKILTCTGDNEGPVAVPVDIDQFRNSGTITPAAGTPGSGVTGGPGSAGIVNDGTIRGDLSSAISVKSLRAGARITNNGTLTVDNSQSRGANNFGILVEQSGAGLTTIIENAGRIEADGPYGGGILAYGNARILHAGPNALIEIGGLGGTAISGERADVSILAPVRAAEGNGVDANGQRMVDEAREKQVARVPPHRRVHLARQTEARDFGDPLAARDRAGDEMREEPVENCRPRCRQQARRGEMAAVPVGHDEVGRMRVVELVDLEAAGQHRQIPFQKIDEDALARLEHRAKRDMLARPVVPAHDDHH